MREHTKLAQPRKDEADTEHKLSADVDAMLNSSRLPPMLSPQDCSSFMCTQCAMALMSVNHRPAKLCKCLLSAIQNANCSIERLSVERKIRWSPTTRCIC